MLSTTVHIACLCAAWCRLCDDYQVVLREQVLASQAWGLDVQWHWIDIEDQADLLGEFEVDTFPTLLIVDAQHVRFAGAITPQPHTLRQLLRVNVLEATTSSHWPAAGRALQGLVQQLRSGAVPVL